MTVKPISPCDESGLQVLLFGDEGSDQFRAAAEHVELCNTCQQRLTDLAGDSRSWSDVHELLGDTDADLLPVHGQALEPGVSERVLGFLESPSHPELLGRLGRYEIERVIGRGGMGIVLKGFDTELNRPVAVKVLAPHLAHSGAARQRFAREGRAAAAVVHEHVVAIHNVESEGEVPFLVMQYVAGESLQARVQRQGPLGTSEIFRIGNQAAAGLAAAHEQGLVHRDIKPANLLLETGVERALLTDFGLARAMDDASLTHTGIVAGTPHYMSPEQADGRAVDHRSDLFSLGSVLYFMATGHSPFRAEGAMAVLHRICHDRHRPVREINPEVPEQLASVIDRLLDKRPSRRPNNAAEVQQTLARLLSDLQQGRLRRPGLWQRLTRRNRIAACVAMSSVTIALAFWSQTWFEPSDVAAPKSRIGPSAPVHIGEVYPSDSHSRDFNSGDSISELLSFGPAAEMEYATEAAGIQAELSGLEPQLPVADAFMQPLPTAWHVESNAVGRDLSLLEDLPYPDLMPQGDKR